jgi:hypothetical protein
MTRNKVPKDAPPPKGSFMEQLFLEHKVDFGSPTRIMPETWFYIMSLRAKDLEFEKSRSQVALHQNTELSNQNTELSNQNTELSNQNTELSNQNTELSNQSESTRQTLIWQNLDMKYENETLLRKLDVTSSKLSMAQNELREIYSSKAWKLTMIMRRIISLAKRRGD